VTNRKVTEQKTSSKGGGQKAMEDKEELFTMRLWKESLDQTQMEWRGKIQHVGSGQIAYFRDWSKMVDFISAALPNLPQSDRVEKEKLSSVDRLHTSRGGAKRGLRDLPSRINLPGNPVRGRLGLANNLNLSGGGNHSQKRRNNRSTLPEIVRAGTRFTQSVGFMFVGAISMILGWDQIGANDPRTTTVVSGLTALLLGAIIISQKLKKLWEHADHRLMNPTS
jgi:hypothetical protein